MPIKYDASGAEQWMQRHAVAGMSKSIGIDASGNAYVAGIRGFDGYVTVKYAPDGTELWSRVVDVGRSDPNLGNRIVVHPHAGIYVAGAVQSETVGADGIDYLLLRYDYDGALLWSQRYYNDQATGYYVALAVDADGNAFVAGGSSDYRIVKFGADGGVQWAATAGGEGGAVTVLRTDADGSVVSGGVIGCDGGPCFAVVRHDAAGNEVWRALHDPGYATSDAVVYDLAIDARGDIAATGLVSIAPATLLTGYLTVKYTSAGTPLWSERYDGGITGFHGASALAMDDAGRIYVTGYAVSDAAGGSRDFTTIRYGNPD